MINLRMLFEKMNKYQVEFFSLILTILFFGILRLPSYATDTYSTFMDPDVWKYMLFSNGRIIIGLVYYMMSLIWNLFPKMDLFSYELSFFLAIIFLSLAVAILARRIRSTIPNNMVAVLLAFAIIVNPLIIEYFLFLEMGGFCFAIFCSVFAFEQTVQFFEQRQMKRIVISFIALLGAVFSYQVIVGLYVILCLPYILKFSKKWSAFLIDNVIVGMLYGGSLGVAYFVTNFLFQSERLSNGISILASILPTIRGIKIVIFDQFYHLPNNYILYELLIVSGISIAKIAISDKKSLSLISYLYIGCGCIVVGFFPFLTGITGIEGLAPRTVYPFGCTMGVLLMYAFLQLDECTWKVEWKLQTASMITVCVFIVLEYSLFQNVLMDQFRCNQTDKYICQMMAERIREYEENSGNTIDTICFYKDASLTWGIDGTDQNGLITRAHAVGWSKLDVLNYYLGTNYQMGDPIESYKEYFDKCDWNHYADKQLIFDEHTLHFCVY